MTGPKVGDRISEYLLDEQVGAGSFGQVWKAHHHIWQEDVVAVKVPTDSQFVRNLQKEGLTIHGLRHPNIVRAIGLDPYADVPYLVMEYVDGPSLRELIDGAPAGLPIRTAQRITCGILKALDHAHKNNVIHRDIKPANVLIAGARSKSIDEIEIDDVKVTDFGLGKAGQVTTASILQSGSLLSEEGRSISGTVAYMSPEQRDGHETDARSDLYAVGIVLFEMLCGERPGGSDLPSHVREGLPSWVDLVYARLYTRRERRYASAADVLDAIDAGCVPPVVIPGSPIAVAGGPGISGETRTCAACGEAVESDDNFCIMCGARLVQEVRRCPKCEAYPAPDDKFCVRCGTGIPARTA
ncbi:MAG: serine/threonine-protein kinase [Planctomycetota bacterium]